nr:MAG TPA: Stem cell factor [Caudoviricetes sp.]
MDWTMTTAIAIVCLVIASMSSALCWEIMQHDD